MHKLRNAPSDSEEDLKKTLEALAGSGKVYLLGLGNADRADDGAGLLVADALRTRFPSFSYSEEDGVEGVALDISERDEDATVFFVDAAEMRLPPGSVRVVPKEEINEREITTHRVYVALLASMLEKAGKRAAVVCIQPGSVGFREAPTDEVKRAIDMVVRALGTVMTARNADA